MNAETAYHFRHALLRDAAYQLQLPGERARLHSLAFEVIEALAGGPPPPPDPKGGFGLRPHAADAYAEDLAEHARLALDGGGPDAARLSDARRHYLRRAAGQARNDFRNEAAEQLWAQYAEMVGGAHKVESLRHAAHAAITIGKPLVAESRFEQALTVAREAADPKLEARVLGDLAGLFNATGRAAQAEQACERSLALHRELGNRPMVGISLGNIGLLYHDSGRHELAEKTLEEALAIHREVKSRRDEGVALGNLANVYRDSGRPAEAERAYLQALAIHREVGNRHSEGLSLGNLALLYGATGSHDLAERTFKEALDLLRAVGDRRAEGARTCDYALFLLARGRIDEARASWRSGEAMLRKIGAGAALEEAEEQMREACARAGVPQFEESS